MDLSHESPPLQPPREGQKVRELKRKYVPRAIQACQMCKQRKIKCDEKRPACSSCNDRGHACIYMENESRNRRKDFPGHKALQQRRQSGLDATQGSYTTSSNSSPTKWFPDRGGTSLSPQVNQEMSDHPENFDSGDAPQPQSATFDAAASPSSAPDEDQAGLDPVGGMNEHTNGMEFYGTSSNFALLSQLISKARSRLSSHSAGDSRLRFSAYNSRESDGHWLRRQEEPLPATSEILENQADTGKRRVLKENRISVVNLLFDEDSAMPDSEMQDSAQSQGMKTPVARANPQSKGHETRPSREMLVHPQSQDLNQFGRPQTKRLSAKAELENGVSNPDVANTLVDTRWVELQLEKEYIRIFFDNLHYIHPFLSQTAFVAQCERDVWNQMGHQNLRKQKSHFFALYNTVIAVGALTAGTDLVESFRSSLAKQQPRRDPKQGTSTPTSVDLSKIYFARAKKSLGDYFEVCSLEGVQALILMSLYSQNALKPHACYMYSGMAVRSALAIGLADECSKAPTAASGEAERTWWAVYSQEVDMCCSSGRRSSLIEPERYRLPFPVGKADGSASPIDMISQMVRFASILMRTSSQLYHNAKEISQSEKSRIALELDKDLLAWRSNLPCWLNSGSHSFTEPEWAGKQRLVLQLRFYNAKILIHRPLMASSDAQSSPNLELHIAACLDGARKTIELLYEAYSHRHYFRTWYYNSTYTLYASMLVLYVVLIDYPHVSSAELIQDVEKSLDILRAMDNVKVAKRCANLISEVLEVVKRQPRTFQDIHNKGEDPTGSATNVMHSGRSRYDNVWIDLGSNATGLVLQNNATAQNLSPTLQDIYETADTTRSNLLASIMDPVALEGFATDAIFDQVGTVGSDSSVIDSGMWMGFDLSQDFSNFASSSNV